LWQYGHANLPFVLQLDSIAYAGKSLIVYSRIACSLKFFFTFVSHVTTPLTQRSYSSSIRGCIYTSMFCPRDFGPEINIDFMFQTQPRRQVVRD
jgi:hypothetical protein